MADKYLAGGDNEDDVRRRSDSQEWTEDGSQGPDDSRSVGSPKSDSGYPTLRTWSDGTRDHLHSSARSVGSVGSQESGHGGRLRAASHMMNGETRFPTATSYASDAQRSDAATVCSGSAVDDIEVESEISQEDHPSLNLSNSHFSPASVEKPSIGQMRRGGSGSGSRLVVFADAPPLPSKDEADPADHHHVAALQGSGPDSTIPMHDMGPPLSRALLLHKGEAPSSQADSVKSFGSNAGSDPGSLDVETHSIETRSVHSNHSHDETPVGEDSTAARADVMECDSSHDVASNPLLTSIPNDNGRRSPGGTIYKGRGTRRYQGRYMHLPLKRFHQNGVHLDSVDERSASYDGKNGEHHDGPNVYHNGESNYRNGYRNGDSNGYRNGESDGHRNGESKGLNDYAGGSNDPRSDRIDSSRRRARSRSRSRSPPQEYSEDKVPAKSSGQDPDIGPLYRPRSGQHSGEKL